MLHPTLQAQISECLDKKTDADNIARLFKKISESYYTYEEQITHLNQQIVTSELANHAI